MKIGLITDIHCNLDGLQHALDLLVDCEEVLCAGDILYQYRFSKEVLDLLQERGVRAITGNHDWTILNAPAHPLRASASVDLRGLAYLGGLPTRLFLELGGLRVAMFHGAPWDAPDEIVAHYIYPQDRRQIERAAAVEADVIILGHTHLPFTAEVGRTLVVNSGSCGECRDGSGLLSCAALDTATRGVEFRRFALPGS
jgi:putative phosphoesterase